MPAAIPKVTEHTLSVAEALPKLEKAYLTLLPAQAALVASLAGGTAGLAGAGGAPSGALAGGADQLGGMAGGVPTAAGGLGVVTFKFNPKEYTISKQANWHRNPVAGAAQAALAQFLGAGARKLSLEIFLDESESKNGSVVRDVEILFSCCAPTVASLAMRMPAPPMVIFGWGATTSFVAFVRSVTARYTMFRPDGTPIRAICSIQLEEIPVPVNRQNPTSGGEDSRRTYTVVEGDSLALIAYREYRDPTKWRIIAEANNLDDPMRIRPGVTLLVPSMQHAAELNPTMEPA